MKNLKNLSRKKIIINTTTEDSNSKKKGKRLYGSECNSMNMGFDFFLLDLNQTPPSPTQDEPDKSEIIITLSSPNTKEQELSLTASESF